LGYAFGPIYNWTEFELKVCGPMGPNKMRAQTLSFEGFVKEIDIYTIVLVLYIILLHY